MHTPKRAVAMEIIALQSRKFFEELTNEVREIRANTPSGVTNEQFFRGDYLTGLSDLMKKYSGVTVHLIDGEHSGPCVYLPRMDANHPFNPEAVKEIVRNGYAYDLEYDVRKIMKTLQTDIIKGKVDLKTGMVSGVFTEFKCEMALPRALFVSDRMASAAGTAAIILHELGHLVTSFEYAGRVFSTNNVLAAMMRTMQPDAKPGDREAVFAKGAELLRMNKEQREAALNASGNSELAVIVLDSAIQTSRSELGLNIYDKTGCEQLADQYAARFGAARDLVLALDTLGEYYTPKGFARVLGWMFTFIATVLVVVLANVFLLISLLMTYVITPEYEIPEHNTTKGRYQRLMNECAEQLKDRSLPEDVKLTIADDYEIIKKIAETASEEFGFMRKVSYFFSPSYRRARKHHSLQNDLEAIGANSLFVSSAKLSTL